MKAIRDEAFALPGTDVVIAHAKGIDHDGARHKAGARESSSMTDISRCSALRHEQVLASFVQREMARSGAHRRLLMIGVSFGRAAVDRKRAARAEWRSPTSLTANRRRHCGLSGRPRYGRSDFLGGGALARANVSVIVIKIEEV